MTGRTLSRLALAAAIASVSSAARANAYLDPACELEVYFAAGAGGEVAVSDPGFLAGAPGDADADGGRAGGGFLVLWGVRPIGFLGLELAWDAWVHPPGPTGGPRVLQALRPGLRFFLADGDFEPYARVSAIVALFGEEFGVSAAGGGIEAGAGLEVRLSPSLSAGIDASWRGIRLDPTEAAGSAAGSSGFLQAVAFAGTLTGHWAW